MKVQSLSVVVPNKKCINNCKFCVARMGNEEYENFVTGRNLYYDLYEKDYMERLQYARDNNCNVLMLTGDSEPQQNWEFLKTFGTLNKSIQSPFKHIEMQTAGTLLNNKYLYFLRHHVGVKTISLSISSFDNVINDKIVNFPNGYKVDIAKLCHLIKQYRFNLRISINLTYYFDNIPAKEIFNYCKNVLLADQIIFRELYKSNNNTDQDKWIEEFGGKKEKLREIVEYICENGDPLNKLEFGAIRYLVHDMSTVVDTNCMGKSSNNDEIKEDLKFLILRPDGKLYTQWDSKGSVLF